jgi:hypothetical protein
VGNVLSPQPPLGKGVGGIPGGGGKPATLGEGGPGGGKGISPFPLGEGEVGWV